MMIMLGNDGSGWTHYMAGKFPGRIGWLMGPRNWKEPRPWLPYACDNDAYTLREHWSESAWFEMLARARLHLCKPRWVLVPDVVGDRHATLERWARYAPHAKIFGWPLAFAAQDGMTPDDVPPDATVVFVGGTTEWKWRTLPIWCASFPRVHVGRVNAIERVWRCEELGAESIDGTGWTRNPSRPDLRPALFDWLEGHRPEQHELALGAPLYLPPENLRRERNTTCRLE